jgi:PTS system mannose-specific IIA component
MIGVVVVTHGQLATELVNAAETIVGELPQFAAVSIGWHEDTEDARGEIEQAIARVEKRVGGVDPDRYVRRNAVEPGDDVPGAGAC